MAFLAERSKIKWLQPFYIFFHELSHAVVAKLQGADISAFKVGMNRGYIKANKSGFFIRLAPYYLPLFSIFTFVIIFLMIASWRLFTEIEALWLLCAQGLIWFSWYVYIFLNIRLIRLETTDLDKKEIFLSLSFMANVSLFWYTLHWKAIAALPEWLELSLSYIFNPAG